MKRLFYLFCLLLSFADFRVHAQTQVVYLICDPLPYEQQLGYGIRRREMSLKACDRSPSIFFKILNDTLKIDCTFGYFDYDFDSLARIRPVRSSDYFEKRVEPVAFLNTISPIDLNAKLPTLTKASAEAWIDELRDKKVYMIDRSEIGPDSVIIRQVRGYYPRGF